jgi:phosphoglycolate phosphatase-like HAD superfamily hydrolase
MHIFLFDLDGVLLNSAGYHRSLVETVRCLSRYLGFGDRRLTQAEIDAFEAHNITAEWDSSALCAALLLMTAWEAGDDVSLPSRPPLGGPRRARHKFPDIRAFLAELDGQEAEDPVAQAELLLLGRLGSADQNRAEQVRSLIRKARSLQASLTFRLIQLFNLGSRRFEQIYGESAGIDSVSFLETYDQPTLLEFERASLLSVLVQPGRAAAIVTNRPSPAGSGVLSTPEAEIGVRVAGFASVPVVASGELARQATTMRLDLQTFLKPSPVHVLAALRRSTGLDSEAAVEAAAALHVEGAMDDAWRPLDGSTVTLFEDAPKGHASARAAVSTLARHGVSVSLDAYGIAVSPDKIGALVAAGARVHPHLRFALDEALPGWRR